MWCISFVILILSMATISFSVKMKIVHEWKYLDYVWDNPKQKENAINSGIYNASMCALNDVDKANDGRIFATIFGFNNIIPASLVTVSDKKGPGGPLLCPYPDWSWYNDNTCDSDNIINAYWFCIQCNHIFVLDNGFSANKICDPKLLIFNLKNNRLVKVIKIPPDIATNKIGSGFLTIPFVYVPGKCNRLLDEMIVFISDLGGNGLVVYDSSKNCLCRVESDFMRATEYVNITIANKTISYMGGIYGLTTIHDDLFYNPLTEKKVYKMKIKELLKCPDKKTANKQTKLAGKLPTQLLGPLASAKCSLFTSGYLQMSIQGTNACKKFYPKDMVTLAQDDEKLQVVTGLKVLQYHNELMALSSKHNIYLYGIVNLDETNFIIVKWDLTKIQKKIYACPKSDKHYV